MKASTSQSFELKEFSKFELIIIKAAIAIFGVVLNISVIGLIF